MQFNSQLTTSVVKRRIFLLPLFFFSLVIGTAGALAQTVLLSKNTTAAIANNHSYSGQISSSGQKVVFASSASDLVSNDHNNLPDIFLYHIDRGHTQRVSIATEGDDTNGASSNPVISANGEIVVFASAADNLIEGDQNGAIDIFLYQTVSGGIERIVDLGSSEVSATESQHIGPSRIALSGDGRFIVFDSIADHLTVDDANNHADIFVYDQQLGTIELISHSLSSPSMSNGDSDHATISEDGQVVAFASQASNLVLDDNNGVSDVFVYDRRRDLTTRISLSSDGIEGDNHSINPIISANGQFIAFYSSASNLDQNQALNDSNERSVSGIYLHDRASGKTTRLTKALDGGWPDSPVNVDFDMSPDANYIAFSSRSQNLTEYWPALCKDNAENTDCFWQETQNIFRYNRLTNHTTLISIDNSGLPLDWDSSEPSLTADGQSIVYTAVSNQFEPENVPKRQLYLASAQTLPPVTLIEPGHDIYEAFPTYSWRADPVASAFRLTISDSLSQPWLSREEIRCSEQAICSSTPLVMLNYGVNSVSIQYATERGEISPPSAPQTIFRWPETPQPEPTIAVEGITPTLHWNSIADASEYQLQVQDRTTNTVVINQVIKNTTAYTLPMPLDSSHSYQWKVKVKKPVGHYSPWVPITHEIQPGIPEPVYPEGSIESVTPTFQWLAAQNATQHRLLIQDMETREVILNKIIKSDLNYTLDMPLEANRQYRWKVRSQSPDGTYSDWLYFESAVNERLANKNRVTLSWQTPANRVDGSPFKPTDISHYIIDYQGEQDKNSETIIVDADSTTLTLNELADDLYLFRIKVVDKNNLSSNFSDNVRVVLPRHPSL